MQLRYLNLPIPAELANFRLSCSSVDFEQDHSRKMPGQFLDQPFLCVANSYSSGNGCLKKPIAV